MTSANFSHKPAHFASRPPLALFTRRTPDSGFTLVEMLVAISITLVMMATVVGVFATVSSSVSKRRAAVEVGNQLRHVRNVLQRDLEGMTCPAIPWQKPESDVGYFEIVEGLHADFYPSSLTDESPSTSSPIPGEIDHRISTVPSSNLPLPDSTWVTDGGGLGDYDDILAFTSRNEKDPFTGAIPSRVQVTGSDSNNLRMPNWQSETITSPVAEVIWFSIENPPVENDDMQFFGEPGMRTIYRRTLLVAPWLDYRFNADTNGVKSRPGVLRVMTGLDEPVDDEPRALAALIAFQERYDISARTEFDPTIGNQGAWTIVANTLADLTDRKNRYEHHGYIVDGNNSARIFGYRMVSSGVGTPSNSVQFWTDPDFGAPGAAASATTVRVGDTVVGYDVTDGQQGQGYLIRPFAAIEGGGTARTMINDNGQVVYVTTGLVPLGSGSKLENRRGADLMMSDVLAFDVQVYDPNAPVYALQADGSAVSSSQASSMTASELANLDMTAVEPDTPGWWTGFAADIAGNQPLVAHRGTYVDLGYAALRLQLQSVSPPAPLVGFAALPHAKSQLGDVGFTRTYDTWNFAYEHDGVNQDGDVDSVGNPIIDEGTNNLDDRDPSLAGDPNMVDHAADFALFGPDDVGERETSPPYPVPLRAVQIKLRVYEPDSRQIREVTVRQHFVPE